MLVASGLALVYPSPASAVVTDDVPNQAQCEAGGSTQVLWGAGTGGRTRPVVTSMTVNGETVTDPANPGDHEIGVAICTPFANARKIGLSLVHREGTSYRSDLTGAKTPSGANYLPTMDIRVEMTNLGSQAEFLSFTQAYGEVRDWDTANLGQPTASVEVTLRPTLQPLVDFTQPGAGLCSATPPVCDVNQSSLDVTTASLYMDFDEAQPFQNMTGAYFATTGAVSGYVTQSAGGIQASLGGPHFQDDGSTLNTGSMQAYLPDGVLAGLLNVDPNTLSDDQLTVTREEGATTTDAPFDLTEVDNGYVIEIDGIGFSSPRYSISSTSSSVPPTSSGGYRMFARDGGAFSYGLPDHGSAASLRLSAPVVGGASHGDGGYWEVAADGGVFAYGDAPFFGSAVGLRLNAPIVGIAPTSNGGGYFLVSADGGVFAFGNAQFQGSAGSLNRSVVGIATSEDGYRLFAADGGVFSYGVQSFGSAASERLARPVVGGAVTSSGDGYWMVAEDGGVFSYGDARFAGSAAPFRPDSVVGMTASGNDGYVLVTRSGAAYAFGSRQYAGGANGLRLAGPVTAIS